MKNLKNVIMIVALMVMLPSRIFAQNDTKSRCMNEDCVFELLLNLNSNDTVVVAEAGQNIFDIVEEARISGDSRLHDILVQPIMMYVEKFRQSEYNGVLLSYLSAVCNGSDIKDIMRLTEIDELADSAIRIIGDIYESAGYIEKYILKHKDGITHKAAWAYAVGKQNITSMEDVLVSWLKDADEKTEYEIYNALVVIKTNKKTVAVIKKGAKRLIKNDNYVYRIGGLRIWNALYGEKAVPMLYKALKDKNGDVRRGALELLKPYANQEVVKKVLKKCKNGEALADAINWLGDIKDDSQMEFLIKQLSSDDPKVVEATIRAMFKIDNAEGINVVKPMFGGDYQDVIKESMIVYEGDYRSLLNDILTKGNDNQKLVGLQIFENRPVLNLRERVKTLTSSNNQAIKDEAFKVLKFVVIPTDADFLKALMDYCDEKYVADVQIALRDAMAQSSADKKDEFVSTMKHVRADVMPRFYNVFAYFGTDLCVDKLIEAYQHGNYKEEAKEALLLVEDEKYAARIQEVLK